MSLLLPAAVVLGILVGHFLFPSAWIPQLDTVTMLSLYLLLVGVGINLVADSNTFTLLRKIRPLALLIIPLSALGSILGGAVAAPLIGETSQLGAAIGAGFGWYSLSSVLLAELISSQVGALAFLTNTFREIFSVLLMPPLIKLCGLAGITLGGATTMDTTLPLISKSGSQETIFVALLHGLILSALVPILVPLLAGLIPS